MPIVEQSGSSGGENPAVQVATVPLSSADILALDTTPVTLVDGIDGFALVPMVLAIVNRPGGSPYAETGQLRLFNGATWGAASWGKFTGLNILSQATSGAVFYASMDEADYEPLNLLDGVPMRLDSSEPITGGNGTAALSVVYFLLPLT